MQPSYPMILKPSRNPKVEHQGVAVFHVANSCKDLAGASKRGGKGGSLSATVKGNLDNKIGRY